MYRNIHETNFKAFRKVALNIPRPFGVHLVGNLSPQSFSNFSNSHKHTHTHSHTTWLDIAFTFPSSFVKFRINKISLVAGIYVGLAVADKAHTCMSTQKHTQTHTCMNVGEQFRHSHIDTSKAPARQQHISINISLRRGATKLLWQAKCCMCSPLCLCLCPVSVCVCIYVWLEFGFSSGCRGFYVFTVLYIWYCGSLACCWLPTSCRSSLIVFCSFKRSAKRETEWMRWGNLNNQLSD